MKIKNFLYFAPAILYYILIFFVSSTSSGISINIPFFDKGIHCLEFAVLAFLLSLGYFKSLKSSLKAKCLITIFSGILLGILDEVHQYFVPQRRFEILDIIADGVGIIIGLFVYLYLSRRVNI